MHRKHYHGLLGLLLFLISSQCFTSTNFALTDSNQGSLSHYIFSFVPGQSYQDVQLAITFPIQYDVSSFGSGVECYYSATGLEEEYGALPCWVEPDAIDNKFFGVGAVVVSLPRVGVNGGNFVVLKNVRNPLLSSGTYFQVCLKKNSIFLQCSKSFGRAILTPPATVLTTGVSITAEPTPQYVGRGTSYYFTAAVSSRTLQYKTQNLRVRVKLPSSFRSDDPLCSIVVYNLNKKDVYSQVNSTILPASENQVDCGPISTLGSWLSSSNELSLKIQNIINPYSSQTYADFSIEIVRQLYMQPIQIITFPLSSITIVPEILNASIKQSNFMRMSTNVYYFMLNHGTTLNQSSSIVVEFLSGGWKIWNCFAVTGFTQGTKLMSQISGNRVRLYNYGVAPHQNQQIFAFNLTSSDLAGPYQVKITTQLFNQTIGIWNGQVTLNQTIGTFNLLSVSAVKAPTKLPVDSTGPLEMTFFLNYELPPADDVTNGTLAITISPQLPLPDPDINGVVKCYWKATLQAANCTMDNSTPNKTHIFVTSPPHDAFKYSQMPLIITTQGGISDSDLGLTIDPLVQRYKFQCAFHLYNSSTIPSQVYYTTWIADAIPMTTNTAISFTHECNEYTHVRIDMVTPLLDSSIAKEFRIKVQFLNADGSAWAFALGYLPNKIYKGYSCIVAGLVGDQIRCDLYTYFGAVTPYSNLHINNDVSGAYVLVSGFVQTVPQGVPVRIEIPKIKVGAVVGAEARIGLSILEETPGQVEPYVELYYQNILAFVTKPPISLPVTPAPNSQPNPIPIQTLNQYDFSLSLTSPALTRYLIYEFPPADLPSLPNTDMSCPTGVCASLGYPANWIVETPAAAVTDPHLMSTLPAHIEAMKYLAARDELKPVFVYSYDGAGNTLGKQRMDVEYTANDLPWARFKFLQPVAYGGLDQWYQVSFTNADVTMSSYSFIRFTLKSGLSFSNPAQCNSTTFLPFNQSQLICLRENDQTIKVFNFKSIAPLSTHSIWFRMKATSPFALSNLTPMVDIYVNHNNSVDMSVIGYVDNVGLVQAPFTLILGSPEKFQIHNPQIVNEDIQIGYIGPAYFRFVSKSAGTYTMTLTFNNHHYNGGFWRTPNTLDLDPMVCLLNNIRYYCTPTNLPLTITIPNVAVTAGTNQLQLDTQYINPYNGIKFPDVPGMYSVQLSLTHPNTTVYSVTMYVEVQPPRVLHMQVGSVVKDIGTESVYKINFTLPMGAVQHVWPGSYQDAANYSRIVIEFPTVVGGRSVFAWNLGGYEGKFNQRVGCYFKQGGPYVPPIATFTLQCRLIPSTKPGQPVKVQILNHQAFDSTLNSMSVYIFKVFNPALAHSSIPITLKIDNIEAGTGNIYPLFKHTYRMFMDPTAKNPSPTIYPSVTGTSSQMFQTGKDVGDYGYISLTAQIVSNNTIVNPYHMIIKLPKYFNPQDPQVTAPFNFCPEAMFEQCVAVPEINYLMVKPKLDNSLFYAYLKNYPPFISQSDSFFYSHIVEEGRLTGIVEHQISAANRWKEIQGDITFVSCLAVGNTNKVIKNRKKFPVQVTFTIANPIPETGSIEIGFPTSITNVQPHCRSMVQLGSALQARAGASGQIGCMVQNTRSWVLTGFNAITTVPATIIVTGQIDLPGVLGSIGNGRITTYYDNNLVDISTNGSRIDHLQNWDFGLMVLDKLAMNANPEIFMTQRSVIRAGYTGQFRMLVKSDAAIKKTDSVTFRMATSDFNGNTGGFTLSPAPKVCQFVRLSTDQQIGCIVTLSTVVAGAIAYTVAPAQNLIAMETYQIRLTTQQFSEPTIPEGITYPSIPGTYKIEVDTRITSVTKTEHTYMQVYGTAFQQLLVTQYNYIAGEYNLIWVELRPATAVISATDQIIIEFPTRALNGTRMFGDDLGLNEYKDGDEVPVDVFDSLPLDNSFITCRIYRGDQLRAAPAKVVCGIASDLAAGTILRLAFGFFNPAPYTLSAVPSQISLPLIVYSYNAYTFKKTNYNLVNSAIYVYNQLSTISPQGFIGTVSNQLQTKNDILFFADAHTYPLMLGDAYVIKLGFPIRVNGRLDSFCNLYVSGSLTVSTAIGNAYYHERLRTIVCVITSATPVPPQTAPTAATMAIQGFFTPWYKLASTEKIVTAFATYRTTTTSQVINYNPGFPDLLPKWQFASQSLLQLQGHIKHYIVCQNDDYIFRAAIESSATTENDLQYTRLVSFHFPPDTIMDYMPVNTDCVQDPTSTIQVIRCDIDIAARVVYVQIVPGLYTNDRLLVVKTKGLAITNPCQYYTPFVIADFRVYYYSWENATVSDRRNLNNAYMVIDNRNVITTYSLTYSQEVYPTSTLTSPFQFDWAQIPFERSFNEFPQFSPGQTSPFTFDVWLNAALPALGAGLYHTVKLHYGNNFVPKTQTNVLDLFYDKPVCYMHNTRVQRCFLDTANKIIYMQFSFAVPSSKPVHVYFSVLDPRKPENNGFEYIGTTDMDKVRISIIPNGGAEYSFQTPPFVTKQTHVGGTGGPLPQRGIVYASIDWASNITNRLNVLDMTFYVNRSDITGLQFQIPLVSESSVAIYTTTGKNSGFFNIQDGGQYPCGNNLPGNTATGKPKCFILNGDITQMGYPTVITMFDLTYTGSVIKARLLLNNPDVLNSWFSIRVKAFAGAAQLDSVFGYQYVGYWNFPNVFKTITGSFSSNTIYSSTSWPYLVPLKGTWREKTRWYTQPWTMAMTPQVVGGYAMMEVTIRDNSRTSFTDRNFCEVDFPVGDTDSDDMLIVKSKEQDYIKAYFVKKWVTSPWYISFFKCKHYANNMVSHWYANQGVSSLENIYFYLYVVPNSFFPTLSGLANIYYYEIIKNRVQLQYDITGITNNLAASQYVWDRNNNYELVIELGTTVSMWSGSILSCYATGGFLNSVGMTPTCIATSSMSFRVNNFQGFTPRSDGVYILKFELEITQITSSINIVNNQVSLLTLYANSDAMVNAYEYIIRTNTLNSYVRSMVVKQNNWVDTYLCSSYNLYLDRTYSTYITNNLIVDILRMEMISASNLYFKLTIAPTAALTMIRTSYYSFPYLRFFIEGLDFSCLSVPQMLITFINSVGTRTTINTASYGTAVTRCGPSAGFVQVQFYTPSYTYYVDNTWPDFNIFDTTESLEIEATVTISWVTSVTPQVYHRDWLGMRVFLNSMNTYYLFNCNYIYTQLMGSGQEFYWRSNQLADQFRLDAISTTSGQSTEFFITINNFLYSIGKTNANKLLLLQFNTPTHPFDYINGTNLNHIIECQCITSPSATLSPAANVPTECVLRLPQQSFINFAITLDTDVAKNSYLRCWFPGWRAASFTYDATAKLVNKGSSHTPWVKDTRYYGGTYWAKANNTLTFSPATTTTLTVSQNPPVYPSVKYVNTLHTIPYTITITTPVSVVNPVLYINFQKGGLIPDASLCSTGFISCRVYNTLINVIVGQFNSFGLATSTVTLTKASAPILSLPKHVEPGTNYDTLVQLKTNGALRYEHSGNLVRVSTALLPTVLPLHCHPEKTTGTDLEGFKTNIVLSFNLGGHIFNSSPKKLSKFVITCSDTTYLTVQKGCTASSVDLPLLVLDCHILSATREIVVLNPSLTDVTISGLIQVVVGIVNPSTPLTWTVKTYEYYISATNYGQQGEGTATYTPTVWSGVEQTRSTIRMLPFVTKVNTNVHSPFRIYFKLAGTAGGTIPYDFTNRFVLMNFDSMVSFSTFQCMLKQYSLQPLQSPNSPRSNSYRNLRHHTQYLPLPTYCYNIMGNLQIQPPRNRPIYIDNYYQLVVMPTGTLASLTQTGFSNGGTDADVRLFVHPGYGETIAQWLFYTGSNVITLNSMYLVARRPMVSNSLQLRFSLGFTSATIYPNHYLQLYFQDLDMSSIKAPYNSPGSRVPCTLTGFTSAGRTNPPRCVINYVDAVLGELVLRVVQIGTLSAGNYRVALDDFMLPDLASLLLQKSKSFSVCIRVHRPNTNTKYQRCFQQLFVTDGQINTAAVTLGTGTFNNPTSSLYGTPVVASLSYTYPLTSSAQVHEKAVIRLTGGYSESSPTLTFGSHAILWSNAELNLYVVSQPAGTLGSITISNLINPSPYQKAQYQLGNTLQLTYHTDYHPTHVYQFAQTPYPYFQLRASKVILNPAASLQTDITAVGVPTNSPYIARLDVKITDTVADLKTRLNDKFEISFNTGQITKIEQCWVASVMVNAVYSKTGQCQVTQDNKIVLYNLYGANVGADLVIYAKFRQVGTSLSIVSKLYSSNGQIQYNDTYTRSNTRVASTTTHPLLTYTQNFYTPYYFQSAMVPLTISTPSSHLYLHISLPQDMLSLSTMLHLYLPVSIMPANTTQAQQVCEWLLAGQYNRQYDTGVYSACNYTAGVLTVLAPFGGLLSNAGVSKYLLRIREKNVINSQYIMPVTSTPEQILLGFNNTNVFSYDTLIIYPYEHFPSLLIQYSTLNVNQLSTYHVQFTPATTLTPTTQAVLQLSIDNRYMLGDLGMVQLHALYGIDYDNQTRQDMNNYNMGQEMLGSRWVNGGPYSGYTSTLAPANRTTVHAGTGGNARVIRVTHLLETAFVAGTQYVWKIPLLLNPATVAVPFRMNISLWMYGPTSSLGQKQLFYQIVNYRVTAPDAPSAFTYTIPASNPVQSVAADISVQLSWPGPPMDNYIELKLNNRVVGLTGLPILESYGQPDPNYDFYYFKRVNLLLGKKKTLTVSNMVNMGNTYTTNDYADYYGYDWVKMHAAASMTTTRRAGPVNKLLVPCTLVPVASVIEGMTASRDSQFLLMVQFTPNCKLPAKSTFVIEFDSSKLSTVTNVPCYSSFRRYSCQSHPNKIQLISYQLVALGTPVTVRVYLRTIGTGITTLTGSLYGIPGSTFTSTLTLPSVTTLTIVQDNLVDTPRFQHIQHIPIYQLYQMDIRGTLITNQPITTITMKYPFVSTTTNLQRMLLRRNSTSPYGFDYGAELQYYQGVNTVVSAMQSIDIVPVNGLAVYDVVPNVEYTFIMESTNDTGIMNNFTVGPVGAYYLFEYLSENEISQYEVYPLPIAEPMTVLNPYPQIGQVTALGLQFSVRNHSIVPGNRITLQLDSFNLRDDMFRQTSKHKIECVERVIGILTDSPQILCEISQQPTPSAPNQAIIVTLYPTKTVAPLTQIEIWLSPVINPSVVMVAGVTARVDKDCSGQRRCVIAEARGYYRATDTMPLVGGFVGTFTPSATEVLTPAIDHAFSLDPGTYSAMFIRYPQNYDTIMPTTCSISPGSCLIFPSSRQVLAIYSPPTTTVPITIQGMTNGIYLQPPSNSFDLVAITPSSANLYYIPHNNLTTRQLIPSALTPTIMTITPTQTPGIFLRNYMNTVNIQLLGLYSTTFVNVFYINAPVEIATWDDKYCNATMQAVANDPYPTRLLCTYINDTTLKVQIPEGVEENYVIGVTELYAITVHAKFFIRDFLPGDGILYVSTSAISGTFNAYGSHSIANHSYAYYITQAASAINISEHRVPIIGQANFVTESYSQRVPSINESTTFELLLDPMTTQPVTRIQLVIPEQFGYPPVGVHDACQLITTLSTQLTNCYEIRRNNKTIISVQLQPGYDNGARILKLASKNESSWFTAPGEPGSWYNFTVLMYGADGTLLQAQNTKNCSEIQGIDLDLVKIVVTNCMDQKQNQIVDVSFVVGVAGIRQGHQQGLSNGQYYTEIRLMFENNAAFVNDLGLGKKEGEMVGCVTQNIAYKQEIQCRLFYGVNINKQPYISITNYQWIAPGTNVTISLANILNLPQGIRSTVTIAVLLRRVGQTRSAYLYNPASRVLLPTSTLASAPPTAASVSYNVPRVVNSPTVLNFTITPSMDITSYFVLKFPADGLNDEYSMFSPSCSGASKIDIFYRADVVRLYPSTLHPAGTTRTYLITGFPTPKFAISPQQWNVTIEAYSSLKRVNHRLHTIPSLQIATCRLPFMLVSISSPYTYQTQSTYIFEFSLRLSKASNPLTASLLFPPSYGDVNASAMQCQMDSNASCFLDKYSYVQMTGLRETGKTNHRLTITSVNNPGVLTNTFVLTTYEGVNMEQVMCQSETNVTLVNSNQMACGLNVQASHHTRNNAAEYSFQLQCPNVIKNSSALLIRIPANYYHNNPATVPCWANNRENLIGITCPIVYMNGSYYLSVQPIIINKDEKSLTINAKINNPVVTGIYNFTAMLSVTNFTYGRTNDDSITILDNAVRTIMSPALISLPAQSNVQAYYFLRVPTASVNSSLQLQFPREFELPAQVQVQKFVSNSSTWASGLRYSDVLGLSGVPLQSSVNRQNIMQQSLWVSDTNTSTQTTGTWTYFMIKKITNPSHQSTLNFTLNSYSTSKPGQNLLVGRTSSLLNYTLRPPTADAIQTGISVTDNDVRGWTQYTLTYRLMAPLQTNRTTLYLFSPWGGFNYALGAVNCTLRVNVTGGAAYTAQCGVLRDSYKFNISTDGLLLPADTDIVITLSNLYNPPNATDCSIFAHHLLSHYPLHILKNDLTLSHSTLTPTNLHSPCQMYRIIRADILVSVPQMLYSGIVHEYVVRLTQPTKMLLVMLNSTNPSISFVPDRMYFPDYDTMEFRGHVVVSPIAVRQQQVYINITHQESGSFDMYRPNLPIPVRIETGNKQYVLVQQMQAESIGHAITVPITLTKPSPADMYLNITPITDNSLHSAYLHFSSTLVLIPAMSLSSEFSFWYSHDRIPPTLNISLSLHSASPLFHQLRPSMVYFYFGQSSQFATLPPVMSVSLLHTYADNQQFTGRHVYHYSNALYHDQLDPIIIRHQNEAIGSTNASILVHTRHQGTIAYTLHQFGQHNPAPLTPLHLRQLPTATHILSRQDPSFIVNPYSRLTLTHLQPQTTYIVYMMVYSTLGNSARVQMHEFTTGALSMAVRFRIGTLGYVERDQVKIVRILADIMKIDPDRIKIVSSEKYIQDTYRDPRVKNEPVYLHEVVVSPSRANDSVPAETLVVQRLLSSAYGRMRLKELLPSWVGNFDLADLKLLNRVKPGLRAVPTPVRISYYNATFTTSFWAQATVHAMLIEFKNQTKNTLNYTQQAITGTSVTRSQQQLTQKQIITGMGHLGLKPKAHLITKTNPQGEATLFFHQLQPGSKYILYVTATSPQIYEPIINSDSITKTEFYTLWNPNLRNREKLILEEFKSMNMDMYEAIKEFYDNAEIKEKRARVINK